MFPEGEEGPRGRDAVDEEGGEEGPDEDLVPDVDAGHEGALRLLEPENRVEDSNHLDKTYFRFSERLLNTEIRFNFKVFKNNIEGNFKRVFFWRKSIVFVAVDVY